MRVAGRLALFLAQLPSTMTQRLHILRALILVAFLAAYVLPTSLLAQTGTPMPGAGPQSPLPTLQRPDATPEVAGDAEAEALNSAIDAILAQMSVADRVGQLFLITFQGDETDFDSDIAELIYGYRVGGVVLSARNGNFSNAPGVDTPRQVATLANRLQALAYGLLLSDDQVLLPDELPEWPPAGSVFMEPVIKAPPPNLPLFIAVEQLGDSLPTTALRRGFTPLPSQMALGATWDPALTNQVGQIVGRELAAVGVNMLLGPSLDVLEQPRPEQVGTLGTNSFGGDPYWVSQLGRAYIAGIHSGSGGQVVTVARHFPGAGDADRLPDQEVATVQRSIEELRRIALPPFLAVTNRPSLLLNPNGDPSATDAMMSGHIRYSAFQGSSLGRNTPLSLAPELETLLEQEGFAAWRSQGGLLVSNALGAPAIRRYYDPSLTEFPSRRVAMDAFTAGHDLLYLGRFSLDDRWESAKQNIKETIAFFQERYLRDPEFAAQVDASVRRILRLKLRLYNITPENITVENGTPETAPLAPSPAPAPEALSETIPVTTTETAPETTPVASPEPPSAPDSTSTPPVVPLTQVLVRASDLNVLSEENRAPSLVTVGQVARDSFTLLYPDPTSAADVVSVAPQSGDSILIFTDSRLIRECEECIAEAAVGPDDLADIIVRLYGPEGTGQLTPEQIVSLTFSDLAQLLAAEQAPESVEEELPETTPPPIPTETPTSTPITDTPDQSEGAMPLLPALDKNARMNLQIQEADWIIFAMLDVDTARYPNSDVLKRFLSQRGNQLASKHIAVLALHAPYFLDATEISKLNGYYGIYSRTQPFLESAVRGLFRAFTPTGAPPVSVPGTRFGSLAERLAPDPSRPIDLQVLSAEGEVLAGGDEAAQPVLEAGRMVRVQAGPVLDRNGTLVRNGTPVELTLAYLDSPDATEVLMVPTQNGIAARDVVVSRGGTMRLSARAGDAFSVEEVILSVQAPVTVAENGAVTSLAVSMTGTQITTGETALQPGTTGTTPSDEADRRRINLVSLGVALLTMVATSSLLLVVQVRVLPRQHLVHHLLWAINCGLGGYILYGLGLVPGGSWLEGSLRVWGAGLVVFIAMLLPLVWLQLRMD